MVSVCFNFKVKWLLFASKTLIISCGTHPFYHSSFRSNLPIILSHTAGTIEIHSVCFFLKAKWLILASKTLVISCGTHPFHHFSFRSNLPIILSQTAGSIEIVSVCFIFKLKWVNVRQQDTDTLMCLARNTDTIRHLFVRQI